MATVYRRTITLIEILIVITILSLATGIVAVSINKAVVDQRFRSEVSAIVDTMRLAQDLMLILGTDVHVHFKEAGDKGIEFFIEIETTLPENIQREVGRKRPLLKTIKGVFLTDELLTEEKEKHIDVKFLSKGAVMSKGVMRLASSSDERSPKGTLESFICLAGYPKPIITYDTKEEAEKSCRAFDTASDERLTQDMISKIPEKLKQREPVANEDGPKDGDEKKKPPENPPPPQKDNPRARR